MDSNSLPLEELKRILSKLVDKRQWLIKSVTPLTGGLTNSNHLVSISISNSNDEDEDEDEDQDDQLLLRFVIREISHSSTSHLNIDRVSEIKNATLANLWGLSPRILSVVDSKTQHRPQYILIDYVKGRTLSNLDLQNMCQDKAGIEILVRVLRGLHSGGQKNNTIEGDRDEKSSTFENRFDIVETRQQYLNLCEKRGWELPAGYRELESSLQEVISVLEPGEDSNPSKEPLVPCHNDLLAANFILTSRNGMATESVCVTEDEGSSSFPYFHSDLELKLIDFEYSGLNYPSFDLGNLYSESELTESQLRNLIRQYWSCFSLAESPQAQMDVKSIIDSKIARAKLWASVAQMTWIVWATIQANSVQDDFTQVDEREESESGSESQEQEQAKQRKRRNIQVEMKKREYLQWRQVKMESATEMLGEKGKSKREELIKQILRANQ